MWGELRGIVARLANPHLKALLEAMLDDENRRRYRRAPAAKQIHHAYLGGLIDTCFRCAPWRNFLKDCCSALLLVTPFWTAVGIAVHLLTK